MGESKERERARSEESNWGIREVERERENRIGNKRWERRESEV